MDLEVRGDPRYWERQAAMGPSPPQTDPNARLIPTPEPVSMARLRQENERLSAELQASKEETRLNHESAKGWENYGLELRTQYEALEQTFEENKGQLQDLLRSCNQKEDACNQRTLPTIYADRSDRLPHLLRRCHSRRVPQPSLT